MTWTYRIIKDEHGGHRIAEVYTGLPHVPGGISWTADPIHPWGESADEIRRDLERMMAAFEHPVLDEADLQAAVRATE